MKVRIEFEAGPLEMAQMMRKIEIPEQYVQIESTPDELEKYSSTDYMDDFQIADIITEIVCKHFLTSVEEVKGKGRERYKCEARFTAMRLIRERIPVLSLSRIGVYMGGRDHASVIHAIECHKDLCKSSFNFAKKYGTIKDELMRVLK